MKTTVVKGVLTSYEFMLAIYLVTHDGVLDRVATILCSSDAVMDPVSRVGSSALYGGIDSACIVEEASNNLLDVFFVGFVKFGTCVNRVSSLIVLAILDWILFVGAILRLCMMWIVITEKLFGNIGRHCYVNIPFVIVPSERDTTIEIALPIFNNFVRLCRKGSKEVIEVFVTNVFDAKVIHAQVESDGS
jgi:hypothetical protein